VHDVLRLRLFPHYLDGEAERGATVVLVQDTDGLAVARAKAGDRFGIQAVPFRLGVV
jgi:hypothetical protein